MTATDNKRIARNTLFLYLRIILVMGVTLFTSRIILDALGVEDFGVYNLVGGVSASLVFFSATLATTAQRYMNYEMAREGGNWVKMFNLSFMIFAALAVLTVIAGLTGGRWFVDTQLVIPPDKLPAARQVLYATTLSMAAYVVSSAYEAVLITHENMKIYAYLGLVEAVGKLALAYLTHLFADRLIVYSWMLFGVMLLPKAAIIIYCHRRYPALSLRRVWDAAKLREMAGFASWNLFNAIVWILNDQGVTFMLNIFFGPVVNAARAVTMQVNNAINNFSSNFTVAFRPQVVKRYASGELASMVDLTLASSRISVYMLWIICLPFILRARYILSLWLTVVPDYTVMFLQGVFYFSAVCALSNSFYAAVTATGRMRRTCLYGNLLFLLAFPAIYVCLHFGAEPVVVYPILAVARLLFVFENVAQLSRLIPLTMTDFLRRSLLPSALVVVLSLAVCTLTDTLFPEGFPGLVGSTATTLTITAAIIYLCGLSKSERTTLREKLLSRIR